MKWFLSICCDNHIYENENDCSAHCWLASTYFIFISFYFSFFFESKHLPIDLTEMKLHFDVQHRYFYRFVYKLQKKGRNREQRDTTKEIEWERKKGIEYEKVQSFKCIFCNIKYIMQRLIQLKIINSKLSPMLVIHNA